jgi:hypothetical protein
MHWCGGSYQYCPWTEPDGASSRPYPQIYFLMVKWSLSLIYKASHHEDIRGVELWSASRPGRFTTREGAPAINSIGGWVGPRFDLGAVEKIKISCPRRGSKSGRPARSYPGSSSFCKITFNIILSHSYFRKQSFECELWGSQVGDCGKYCIPRWYALWSTRSLRGNNSFVYLFINRFFPFFQYFYTFILFPPFSVKAEY